MIKVEKLDSGITLVKHKLVESHAMGMAIFVKAGVVTEDENEKGISHLMEHMHFKGTKNYTQRELAFITDSLGGNLNAYTTKESTCYYAKVLDDNGPKAATVLLDMLNNSTFDPEELEKEKMVVIEEMNMTDDDPDEFIFEKVQLHVLKGGSYGNKILGTEESVSGCTSQMLFDYKKKHYTQDNVIVAIASGENDRGVAKILEDGIKHWNVAESVKPFVESDPYSPEYFSAVRHVEQSHMLMAIPSISVDHECAPARKLASLILGGGMSSRLFQKIREEQGLAYSIYASDYSFSKEGTHIISAGVATNRLESAIKSIRAELEYFKNGGVNQNELELAKEILKTNTVFSYDNMMKTLHYAATSQLLLNKVKTLDEILAKIDAVTIDDVNREAAVIGASENYTVGLVSDNEYDVERIYKS